LDLVSLLVLVWCIANLQLLGKQQKESRSYVQQKPTLGNK
jgi:hypothetical protein